MDNAIVLSFLLVAAISLAIMLTAPTLWRLYSTLRQESPTTYRAMSETIMALSIRLDEVESSNRNDREASRKEITQMHREIGDLQLQVNRLSIRLERWRNYALQLSDMLREKEIAIPEPPEAITPIPVIDDPMVKVAPARLLKILTTSYNMEELHTLAFHLDVQIDDLSGETIGARAQSLIRYCQRHSTYDDLVLAARALRPDIQW